MGHGELSVCRKYEGGVIGGERVVMGIRFRMFQGGQTVRKYSNLRGSVI